MDEGLNMEKSPGVSDEDIVHLLNTKKQKSREILSITNAAVDAISNRAPSQPKTTYGEQYSSRNYSENKENKMDARISDSFVSTGSGDGSFHGQKRVRIPSRLLREIKSPMDRSSSGNISSSESKDTSSGSLFASQSGSEQSSIQATGPVPTVIKYSSQPLKQPKTNPSLDGKHKPHDTPVVIKYLQEYNSEQSSINSMQSNPSHESKDVPMGSNESVKGQSVATAIPATINKNSQQTLVKRNGQSEPEVVSASKDVGEDSLKASHGSALPEKKSLGGEPAEEQIKIKGTGLCQGAPSNNLSFVVDSEQGQVKAVSFNTSNKGRATRDMLTRRQEQGQAVRRVIQPKIVEKNIVEEDDQRISQSVENQSKDAVETGHKNSTNKTVVQFPSEFEEQMKNLMNTLGAIENQCQENRVWQERHQQELEESIKQRDERRLQHLEEMQKQLVEYQLKYAQPVTIAPQHTSASTIVPAPQSATEVSNSAMAHQAIPQSDFQAGHVASQGLTQGMVASNAQYTPTAQHKTKPSFLTTVYNKSREENPKAGVKRKLVRNTRTQTSPQVSSPSSETSSSSPQETPLPRKGHPVPMAREWKSNRGKKHVHFDTPDYKSTGKFVKRTGDSQRLVRSVEGGNKKITETQSLPSSDQYGRPRTFVTSRSPETDHIVNDISRLRQELRDALNETEQTKQSLKNLDDRIQTQISSSEESVVALPDHTRQYPLDAYLRATREVPEELATPKVEDEHKTDQKREVAEREPGLCAYALSVLRDVQKQKENLEWNLLALSRRHDEQYLYNMVEGDENDSEALRIRKDVAKKIEEIDVVVQAELLHEENQRALESQVSVERSRPTNQQRSSTGTRGVPMSMEKRAKLRNTGKENTQNRNKTAGKTKINKPANKPPPKQQPKQSPPKQPSVKRPLEDTTYVSRVYGRPDHVSRRTTIKPEQARYPSSGALKPSSKTRTSAKPRITNPQRLDESSTSTLSEEYRPPIRRGKKSRYYFQPNAGADQSVIEAHFRENQGPLPGQLLPMAIPLGEPRMDPALRLPLYIDEEESRVVPQTMKVSSDIKKPNVAVITLKDEECTQDAETSAAKKKKFIPKKKGKVTLERQILPTVDIDSSAISEISSDRSVKETHEPTILPIPDPLPRPDASEYEEFKDYENVRTLGDDQDSDRSSVDDKEKIISLHGENRTDKPTYQGPAFPPRNISMDIQEPGGFQGALGDVRTPSETVENKARELIEQELLARVVSEMAHPPSDPTLVTRRSSSSPSLAESNDSEPDLAAVIGLRGIQLFVDAGIPVDTELVRNLIMDVLQEKVASMLGYPKPQAETPATTQQQPEDDYTEPESGSEDYSRVQTPVRTPSAASQPESRPLSHVSTPERTQTPESTSASAISPVIDNNLVDATSGHVVTDKLSNEIEEGPLDDSGHKSPIATPVATPSPPQSIRSLPTPEVSEQEKVESEEKSPVETPEVTVSIRDKTPEEDVAEADLKEQTLVEDDVEENDEETGTDVPAIKFELEPEPSETKITNSPSSITTTTYSTRSTMGTVATDDEISEGEQLQPYVHVGQYSEGEFVAPSGITGNMTTLHEIPDDIFDTFSTSSKQPDLVKQAVHGLLKLDNASDESARASDENSISEGQQRLLPGRLLAQNASQDDKSEGEIGGDVVSTLLNKIRQSVRRERPTANAGDDTTSFGEVDKRAVQPFSQNTPRQTWQDSDLSAGEFTTPDRNRVNIEALPMQTLNGAAVSDSDENNNDSQRTSSVSEVPNQTWDTNIIMVTPRKASEPFSLQRPRPSTSYSRQSPPADTELQSTTPRVVHVAEARHVSTPTGFSPSPEQGHGSQVNVTMESLSGIDHVNDSVIGDMADHVIPKPLPSDQRARIQLTLPSAEPSSSVSLISEGMLGSDDSAENILSISGGEV